MKALKALLVRILCWFTHASPCSERALQYIVPKKILVVITDERMGELLLAGPLIKALAAVFPAAETTLLCAARFEWLGKRLPGVKKVIPFDKRATFRKPGEFLAMVRQLRAEAFDLAVDGGKDDELSLTTAILIGLSKANVRLGHMREHTPFLTLALPTGTGNIPEADRRLNLINAFSSKKFGGRLQITTNRQAVTMISMGAGVIRHRVGIYPGARKPDHRIEPDVFSGIARGLGENGCEVMIIPGLDNREICLEIAEKSGARLAAVAQGESICSLIGSMDLMICNNTGPMHLSVAMGVPTLGLFIATDPVRWGHNTEPHLTIDFRRARPEAGFINQTALQMVNKPLW